jgi:hypothetical protein
MPERPAAEALLDAPAYVLDVSAPLAPHRFDATVARAARRVVGGVAVAGEHAVGFVCSAEAAHDLEISCWPRQPAPMSLDRLFPGSVTITVVAAARDPRRVTLAVNARLERMCGNGRRIDVARVETAWRSLAQIGAAERFRAEQQRYLAG